MKHQMETYFARGLQVNFVHIAIEQLEGEPLEVEPKNERGQHDLSSCGYPEALNLERSIYGYASIDSQRYGWMQPHIQTD